MDALRAEIERKRRAKEELVEPLRAQGKKWVKRSEIEAQEAERYRQAQRAKLAEKQPQPSAVQGATAAVATAAQAAAPAAADGSAPPVAVPPLSDLVVQKRLRLLGEPITLFGEESGPRYARYLLVADRLKEMHNVDDDLRKGQLVNERQKYQRMQHDQRTREGAQSAEAKAAGGGAADEESAAALAGDGEGAGAGGDRKATGAKRCDLLVQLDSLFGSAPSSAAAASAAATAAAAASTKGGGAPPSATAPVPSAGSGAFGVASAEAISVLRTMHKLLSEWNHEINSFSDEERRTVRAQQAALTFTETALHLRPLLSQLLSGRVPADLLQHIVKIFAHVDNRQYKAATDAYILAAIGNAAWPIGVTMVGIHSRSAREKIQATHTAHVMNDETQRKYLTGVKRLITFAQKAHPTLPSQMVLHWNYDKSRAPEGPAGTSELSK